MIRSGTQTIERVEVDAPALGNGERFGVIIYNNSTTPLLDVISVLIEATDCSFDEAETETMEAHLLGEAWVHFSASQEECFRIARVIETVGVTTDVKKEWN